MTPAPNKKTIIRKRFPSSLRVFAFFFILSCFSGLMTGCVSNHLLLETRANDPIMMNLLDNDQDLAQIEDGTGFVGEATACPT